MLDITRKELIVVGAAYAVAVVLMAAGSAVRPRELWAFSAYSYFAGWWVWAPVAIAVAWAIGSKWLSVPVTGRERVDGAGKRRAWLWSMGHIAVMGVLFVVWRAQAHFLGDGYTLLGSYGSAHPIIKARAMGEAVLHLWVRDIVGSLTAGTALLSFQVIAVGAGVVYLGLVWWSSVRLFGRRREAVLFATGMGTPGYLLLFFGYVELYAVFVMAVGAFGLAGLLAADGRVNRWWILVPLGAAMALHVMGVVLIPAASYVLLTGTRIGGWVGGWSLKVKAGGIVGAVAVGGAAFVYLSQEWSYFKLAFVPVAESRFTSEGYTLFSGRHLLDVANQALTLFPGLLVAVPALAMLFWREKIQGPRAWFLLLFAISAWGAVFLFDPKIGMPRDWDLFAFAGVPLALACLYPLVTRAGVMGMAAPVVVLVIGLNGIVLGGRVALQTEPAEAAEQYRQHMLWDVARHQTGWTILVNHYSAAGDTARAQEEYVFWLAQYPGYERNRVGLEWLSAGRVEEAVAAFRQVVQENPTFGPGYANLGAGYLRMRQLDSAEVYLDIARGMNPYNPATLVNYGRLLWVKNDHEGAVRAWREALGIDSTEYRAAMGLAEYYRERVDREEYFRYLALAVAHSDAPAARLAELGAHYLSTGRREEGEAHLREAFAKGLDSSSVRQLRERYPSLVL